MWSALFLERYPSKAGSGLGCVVLGVMSVETRLEVMGGNEFYKKECGEKKEEKMRMKPGEHTF